MLGNYCGTRTGIAPFTVRIRVVNPRQPVAVRQHEREDPPAARQHQHQQPGDREGDDGVPGGEAQSGVRHPAQNRVRHRRPGPLPLHQQLGHLLQDELKGTTSTSAAARRQRRHTRAPAANISGMPSTPRYWAASIGRTSGQPIWTTKIIDLATGPGRRSIVPAGE
jgi:hypothetical protein